jgi:membrane associated rhomboid family serine protease
VNLASERIHALERDLVVEKGFAPLGQMLPAAAGAEGLFEACLGRVEGGKARVFAFLSWHGQDAEEVRSRSQFLRRMLAAASAHLPMRVVVSFFLVGNSESELPFMTRALESVEEGHFLEKILFMRGAAAASSGRVDYRGRLEPEPPLEWLEEGLLRGGRHDAEEAKAVLERQGREEEKARKLFGARDTWATWALIALCTAAFLAEYFVARQLEASGQPGPPAWDKALELLGANQGYYVFSRGEFWRLGACIFLHAGLLHLCMNMLSLFTLGSLLERMSGPLRMLFIYFVAGLCGSLLSALSGSAHLSVGASGAIFGLAGALLALRFRRPPNVPEALARRIFEALFRPVFFFILLGVVLVLLQSPLLLDNWAHLGGLGMGFGLAFFWPALLKRPPKEARSNGQAVL